MASVNTELDQFVYFWWSSYDGSILGMFLTAWIYFFLNLAFDNLTVKAVTVLNKLSNTFYRCLRLQIYASQKLIVMVFFVCSEVSYEKNWELYFGSVIAF